MNATHGQALELLFYRSFDRASVVGCSCQPLCYPLEGLLHHAWVPLRFLCSRVSLRLPLGSGDLHRFLFPSRVKRTSMVPCLPCSSFL